MNLRKSSIFPLNGFESRAELKKSLITILSEKPLTFKDLMNVFLYKSGPKNFENIRKYVSQLLNTNNAFLYNRPYWSVHLTHIVPHKKRRQKLKQYRIKPKNVPEELQNLHEISIQLEKIEQPKRNAKVPNSKKILENRKTLENPVLQIKDNIIEISDNDDDEDYVEQLPNSALFYIGTITDALQHFPYKVASFDEIFQFLQESDRTKHIPKAPISDTLSVYGERHFKKYNISNEYIMWGIKDNRNLADIIEDYFSIFKVVLDDIVVGTAEGISNYLKNPRISNETINIILAQYGHKYLVVDKIGKSVNYSVIIKSEI